MRQAVRDTQPFPAYVTTIFEGGESAQACRARALTREDVLRDSAILQRTLNALRGNALVPRGVYRFSSHEEADAWMTLQIAATHARLRRAPVDVQRTVFDWLETK